MKTVTYFQYLKINGGAVVLSFNVLFWSFMLYWKLDGAELYEFRFSIPVWAAVMLAWLLGNWIRWRKL